MCSLESTTLLQKGKQAKRLLINRAFIINHVFTYKIKFLGNAAPDTSVEKVLMYFSDESYF
jgi:hypothetical protein